MPLSAETTVSQLNRVGAATAGALKRVGVLTVGDLLRYLPSRYDDFSQTKPIGSLRAGDSVTVQGKVQLIETRRSRRRGLSLTEAVIQDDTGTIKAVWFNQPFLAKTLRPGDSVSLAGRVTYDVHTLQLANPAYERQAASGLHTGRLVPVYPLTGNLTQRQVRFLLSQAILAAGALSEPMPRTLLARLHLPALGWSLRQVHFPDTQANLDRAVRRLKFDELLLLQLRVALTRREFTQAAAPAIPFDADQTKTLIAGFGFALTDDQRKAAWQILQDIGQPKPMNRLLEGEVGSGKTAVVAIAAAGASAAGYQSVFLAPTDLLARQHATTLVRLLAAAGLRVGLLTRTAATINTREVKRTELLKRLADGSIDVCTGTHALLEDKVKFANLALAVVDEQHRFGVQQRQTLRAKAAAGSPHFLSLTATPIPRSLSLVFYGDLDISIISRLPPGRRPVATRVVLPHQRETVYAAVRAAVQAGRQAFITCPLIDPSDTLGVRSVSQEYERLRTEVLSDLKVGFLHGRLKPADKEATMAAFLANQTQVLVTTTVVEVGVDVPNATVMVIEGADRFGLAQLYQLRGRVGRATHESSCFLLTDSDADATMRRLEAFLKAKNCFELAEADLEFRGPGQLFGSQQSGFLDLKIATPQDTELAQIARETAREIVGDESWTQRYPDLAELVKDELTLAHLE